MVIPVTGCYRRCLGEERSSQVGHDGAAGRLSEHRSVCLVEWPAPYLPVQQDVTLAPTLLIPCLLEVKVTEVLMSRTGLTMCASLHIDDMEGCEPLPLTPTLYARLYAVFPLFAS